VLYFLPKTNLYYKLEHELQPQGIIIHNEHVDDKRLWLEVLDAELYVQKIESMRIGKSTIMLFGVYNKIDLEKITLASTLGQFVPKNIQSAHFRYGLYDPLNINATVLGDFGKAEIRLNLYDRLITANIEASKLMKSKFSATLRNLTRDKKGGYHYEYRF
jgi:hypothetical protein